MSQQKINTGTNAGAGDGDDLRVAFTKVNENFDDIYGGNVVAGNVLVNSVAGRQGNVVLTWQDVSGVATTGQITGVYTALDAANAASQAFTTNAIDNLGPISDLQATGGTIASVQLIGSTYGSLANLTVLNDQNIDGSLVVGGAVSVAGAAQLHDVSLSRITFADSTSITSIADLGLASLTSQVLTVQNGLSTISSQLGQTNSGQSSSNVILAAAVANIATNTNNINQLFANANVQANLLVGLGTATNASIGTFLSRIQAANAAILAVQANVNAANAAIVNVTNAWTANASAQGALIHSLTANAATQETEISGLRANIVLINSNIADLAIPGLAVTNANVAAANAAIAGLQYSLIATNAAIASTNGNVAGISSSINQLFTNAASQASSLSLLSANAAAQAIGINSTNANVSAVVSAIDATNANITAANAAISNISSGNIPAINANITAANAAILANFNKITAANAQIAQKANSVNPSFTGNMTAGGLVLTGNASMNTIVATNAVFNSLTGQIATAAQPQITSLGILTGLSVNGNILAINVTASNITGPVHGNQTGITGVGTLGALAVAGNVQAGNVNASSALFTQISGTLLTNAQPNITSVGALNTLNVAGTANIVGNATIANVSAGMVTATTGFTGNILTTQQLNISRVGSLTALNVIGNTTATNITATGTVVAPSIVGTLLTNAQPNINSVGNLAGLNVQGNLTVTGNINTTGGAKMSLGTLYVRDLLVTPNVYASILTGGLTTAAQPNITSVGTLSSLTVSGNVTAGNVTITGALALPAITTNVTGTTSNVSNMVNAGNVFANAGLVTANVIAGNTSVFGNSYVTNRITAFTGNFVNIWGTLTNAAQPNITSLGTLTGLTVDGPVNITGTELVSQNMYITGNLYVAGNTTTISSANVTTSDKDITLANGAVSSIAAAGAGILIGVGGAYGSLVVDSASNWFTPNALTTGGNITAHNLVTSGNVYAGYSNVVLTTAAQTNITSVGTLSNLTVAGNVTANGNITVGGNLYVAYSNLVLTTAAQPNITSIGNLTTANVSGNIIAGNITVTGNVYSTYSNAILLYGNQTAITKIGTLANLTVTGNVSTGNVSGTTGAFTNVVVASAVTATTLTVSGNVSTGNVSGTTGAFTNVIGTLLTNAQPNITTVGNLTGLTVAGVINIGGLNITGLGSLLSVGNLSVSDNFLANSIYSAGNIYFNTLTGTLLTNAQPNITSIGNLTTANISGNITVGNLVTTGAIYGTIATASQTNITTIGTLGSLAVTGNISSGNVSGTTGSFANVIANLLLGNSVTVSGNVSGNVGIFDSIQLAGGGGAGATLNANILGIYGNFSYVTGTIQNNVQKNITTVGNLGNLAVVGNITTANITANTATIGNIYGNILTAAQPNITSLGTLGSLAVTGNITAANITADIGAVNISTSNLSATTAIVAPLITVTTANVTGNITAANITADIGANNISTSNLSVTGTFTAPATTVANSNVSGNLIAGNIYSTNTTDTNLLTVRGISSMIGNVSASNVSVTGDLNILRGNMYALASNITAANVTSTGTGVFNTLIASSINSLGTINAQGSVSVGNNLYVPGNVYIGNASATGQTTTYIYDNIRQDSAAASVGIYSNVASALLYPTSTTTIDLGSAATTVNIGAISGGGNTTIRNYLTVAGGIFANTNVGVISVANVYARYSFANILTVRNSANIAGNLYVGSKTTGVGNVIIASITDNNSIYANTGALQVAGGAGIAGNLYIGGNLSVAGNINLQSLKLSSINGTPVGNSQPSTGTFTNLQIVYQKPSRPALFMFDFINGGKLDSSITYTRTGPGTYFDRSGNLMVAPAQTPRITWDPATLYPRGLYVEESRQNLQVQSDLFANTSVWQTFGASFVSNATSTTSPTGKFNAYKLVDNSSTGFHGFSPIESINGGYAPALSQNQLYTVSIMAKAGERTQFAITFQGEGAGSVFDVQNGVLLSEGANYASSIQILANGWMRCSSTVLKQNTSGNIQIETTVGGSVTYTGDGTSGLYFYGYQLEVGSFSTSYIPNRLVANTRGTDTVTVSSDQFYKKVSQSADSFAVDMSLDNAPSTLMVNNYRNTIFSINDGTTANRVSIVAESQNNPPARAANLVIYGSSVLQTNVTIGQANLTGVYNANISAYTGNKLGGYFKTGNIATAFNGNSVVQYQTYSNIGSGWTQMTLGTGTGTAALNGAIAKLQFWDGTSTSYELAATTFQ